MTTRVTGTITASAQTVALSLDPNDVSASILLSGTYAGISLAFEVSLDGSTWFPGLAVRNDALASASITAVLGTNASSVWNLQVAQFRMVRIRSTAYTSGTLNAILISDDQPLIVPEMATVAVAADPTAVYTSFTLKSAATQNATSVKVSAGNLHNLLITNTVATPTFLKLYDKASAPVSATDVPVIIVPVAASAFVTVNFGTAGKRFATGIAFQFAGAVADTDVTPVTAGQIYMAFDYE